MSQCLSLRSALGILTASICRSGRHRTKLPSAPNAKKPCSPVSAGGKVTLRTALEQVPTPLATPRRVPEACPEQMVPRALGERAGKEMAKQQGRGRTVLERPAAQGRDPGCSGKHNLHLGFWGPEAVGVGWGEASLPLCPGLGLCRESSKLRTKEMPVTRSPGRH